MNWEHVLDKYGLAVAFLAVVIAGVYVVGRYAIWPLIMRLMTALETQLSEARAARLTDQKEFLLALERRDRVSDEQTRAFQDALKQIEAQRSRK